MIEKLKLADIKATIKTQTREEINADTLRDYTEVAKAAKAKGADSPFPPLVAHRNFEGVINLSDGFTRRQALAKAGYEETDVNVLEGELRDAIEYGFKANLEHGARLTNEDKKHNLDMALKDEEWAKLTNTGLADLLGVSESFVRTNRPAAKAPATRTSVDKKTGAKKEVTATRTKKADKPAKPKKEPKADKKGKSAPNDKAPEPKTDEALEAAYTKLINTLGKGPIDGATTVAAIKDGSLPMTAADVKHWVQTSPERIKALAPLLVQNRWPLGKAQKLLDKVPDGDTKAEHFTNLAVAHGGLVRERVDAFTFIVFDAEAYEVGENTKGVITLTPKKKA